MKNKIGEMIKLRDTRKDVDYFDKYIAFRKKTIKEEHDNLSVLTLSGGIGISTWTIFDYSVIVCILKYGRGDELSSM